LLKGILIDSLVVSFAGGLLALDRTAAFQFMVSRPIVAAPVIGWLLGNAGAGLVVGVVVEMLFIGDLPVGAYVPVHETGLSVLTTALIVTAISSAGADPGVFTAAVTVPIFLIVGLPVSRLYRKADTLTRRVNSRFFHSAEYHLNASQDAPLARENMKGLAVFFTTSVVSLFVTAAPLMYAVSLAASALSLSGSMYPALAGSAIVALAAAYNALYTDKSVFIFPASGVAGAVVWILAR